MAKIAERNDEKLGLTRHQLDILMNFKDKASLTLGSLKDTNERLSDLKVKDVMERLKQTQDLLTKRRTAHGEEL